MTIVRLIFNQEFYYAVIKEIDPDFLLYVRLIFVIKYMFKHFQIKSFLTFKHLPKRSLFLLLQVTVENPYAFKYTVIPE